MKTIFAFLAVVAAVTYGAISVVSSNFADGECQKQAMHWADWGGNASHMQSMNDPNQREYFALELAKAKLSCPKGHVLIEEKMIPDEVKFLANDPRIISNAEKKMEQEKKNK